MTVYSSTVERPTVILPRMTFGLSNGVTSMHHPFRLCKVRREATVKCGIPRDDELYEVTEEKISALRRKFGIPQGKKLYCMLLLGEIARMEAPVILLHRL